MQDGMALLMTLSSKNQQQAQSEVSYDKMLFEGKNYHSSSEAPDRREVDNPTLSERSPHTSTRSGGAAFNLAIICNRIRRTMSDMEQFHTAVDVFASDTREIAKGFAILLVILDGRVKHQDELSPGLQTLTTKFETLLTEYWSLVEKLSKESIRMQLLSHPVVDELRHKTKKIAVTLKESVAMEFAIPCRNDDVSVLEEEVARRQERYLVALKSDEAHNELSVVEYVLEILQLLKSKRVQPRYPLLDRIQTQMQYYCYGNRRLLPAWFAEDDIALAWNETSMKKCGEKSAIFSGTYDGQPVTLQFYELDRELTQEEEDLFHTKTNGMERLAHDNILRCYGIWSVTITMCVVVTESCEKGTLTQFLNESKPNLRSAIAFDLLRQVADALVHINDSNLRHVALRYDNILVSGPRLQAKVRHFDDADGFAKVLMPSYQEEERCFRYSDRMVRWLAPECLRGDHPSRVSAVYSFGMTLYEALTGKLPYYHLASDEDIEIAKRASELPSRESNLVSDEAWELITEACGLDEKSRLPMEAMLGILRSPVGLSLGKEGLSDTDMDYEVWEHYNPWSSFYNDLLEFDPDDQD